MHRMLFKLRHRGIITWLMGLLAIIACALTVAMVVVGVIDSAEVPGLEPVAMGNSQSNLANRGLVIARGDWVYYADPAARYQIKRRSEKDGRLEILMGVSGMYMSADDTHLYYVDMLTDRLSRVRMSGQEIERLTEERVSFAMLLGDRLIYTALEDAGIYTCRKDGTRTLSLSTARAQQLVALYGRLYFSDLDRGGMTSHMNLADGSAPGREDWQLGRTALPMEESVYFIDTQGDQRVYQVDFSDQDTSRVSDAGIGIATGIAGANGKLYCILPENGGRLHVKDHDRDMQLTDYPAFAPQIIGDWVYVCRADEDGKVYRVNTNTGISEQMP